MRMYIFKSLFLIGFCLAVFSMAVPSRAQTAENLNTSAPRVHVVTIKGAITPPTEQFILSKLEESALRKDAVFVLALDTPGGLLTSTKNIVQGILKSRVPVVTYVSPAGAHAASAGTFITYASHIAAMAPTSNLGAATPVTLEREKHQISPMDTMSRKMVQDSVAFIVGLAELRGRNTDFARKSVEDAATMTAGDAVKNNVVDIIAADIDELIRQIDQRTVTMDGGDKRTLNLAHVHITHEPDSWRTDFFSAIADPNIALILMTLGMYGLIYEFATPGGFFAGTAGIICLLLGLYAVDAVSLNIAGLGLVLAGLVMMGMEAFLPSFGILAIGGLIAFSLGAVMLVDTGMVDFGMHGATIAGIALTSILILSVALGYIIRAYRRKPVQTGKESIIGKTVPVMTWDDTHGTVLVQGEIWQATASGGAVLSKGSLAKIVKADSLVLVVEPAA